MKTESKVLHTDKDSKNKPVQESLPSNEQHPLGDDNDIKKNEEQLKKDDDNDTNSVGILKD